MTTSFRDVMRFIARSAKRVAVSIVGGALVLGGIALLVLPGPGFLVIALGFAVLATEFAWAYIVLEFGKRHTERAVGAAKRGVRGVFRRGQPPS